MYRLGITGGMGSGKSTAASFFKKKGAVVFDADKESKNHLQSTISLQHKIVDIFDMLQKSIGLYGMKNSKKNSENLDILISPDLPSVNVINFENSIMKNLQKRGEKEAHNNMKLLLNLKEKLTINNDFIKFSGLKDTFKINSVFLNNILIDTTNKSFGIFVSSSPVVNIFSIE